MSEKIEKIDDKTTKVQISLHAKTVENVSNKILKIFQEDKMTPAESLAILNITANFISKTYGVQLSPNQPDTEVLERDPDAETEAIQTQ